ncbi:MAG: glycosyltransferase [Alphaproteobacteria bacterium]
MIIFLLICAGLINNLARTVYGVASIFGLICGLFSLLRGSAALVRAPRASALLNISSEMPSFAVLLPVYHEAHMIAPLTHYILTTDYPREHLDIVIICEPDDIQTIKAARNIAEQRSGLTGKPPLRVFITDGTGPKTKPNALNQALETVKSDIVTVYDAEDRPHETQLRAASYALTANPTWAVAQAPLTYYNAAQNWLTRQFTLEYAALFQVWLPFLARLGLPFPLGGTSNHISGLM